MSRWDSFYGNGSTTPIMFLFHHGKTEPDQGAAVRIGQRHVVSKFTAEDLVFLSEEIIFLGEVFTEEFLNGGNQWNGGATEIRLHAYEITRSEG